MPVHLPVQNFRVRTLTAGRMEVTWEVAATSVDVRDYTFQVLRSESPEGPFDPVTQAFEDRYIFVDSRVPTGDKFRQLWYRLLITHKASTDTKTTPSVTHEADADLIAEYIRKAEQTIFSEYIGRAVWLFKRRTFGTRCASCWEPRLNKRIRNGCLDCFDVGFLRGFWDPMEVWMQIDPEGRAKQNHAQQIGQETVTSARMTFYPNVSKGDVVVEAENKRWRVDRITRSERLRAPVKQELVMRQIEDSDIEYKLPINLATALRDIQPSPVRNFENAKDLMSAIDRRTPNIFANYTTRPTSAPEE